MLLGCEQQLVLEDPETACRRLSEFGSRAVLITGGDQAGEQAVDYYFNKESIELLSEPRLALPNTHGSGCAFSAGIAARLASGMDLGSAVFEAKRAMASMLIC